MLGRLIRGLKRTLLPRDPTLATSSSATSKLPARVGRAVQEWGHATPTPRVSLAQCVLGGAEFLWRTGWAGDRSENGLQLKMVLEPKSQMRAFIYAAEAVSSVHRSCLLLECRQHIARPPGPPI